MILQIVVFHIVGVLMGSAEEGNGRMWGVIHSFLENYHVNSFLLLSGVVWHQSEDFWAFIVKKAKRLLVPYFVFGFAWAVAFYIGGDIFVKGHPEYNIGKLSTGISSVLTYIVAVCLANGYPEGLGFRIINVLWFLPAMFLCSAIYFVIYKYCKHTTHKIVAFVVLLWVWFLVRWLPIPWGGNGVPRFVIFMMLGTYLSNYLSSCKMRAIGKLMWALILLGLLMIPGFVNSFLRVVGLSDFDVFLKGLLGGLATALIAQVVNVRALQYFGAASIGVLVIHKFPIVLIQSIPGLVHSISNESALMAGFFCLLTMLAVSLFSVAVILAIRRSVPIIIGEDFKEVDVIR